MAAKARRARLGEEIVRAKKEDKDLCFVEMGIGQRFLQEAALRFPLLVVHIGVSGGHPVRQPALRDATL